MRFPNPRSVWRSCWPRRMWRRSAPRRRRKTSTRRWWPSSPKSRASRMEWRGDTHRRPEPCILGYQRRDAERRRGHRRAGPGTKNYRNAGAGMPCEANRWHEAFAENLSRLEVCCQKGLSERFDASIGAGDSVDAVCRQVPADAGRRHGGEDPAARRERPTTPPP